jgi:hypothetical protein
LFAVASLCSLAGCGEVPEKGPLPKAVVDEPQVDFGKVAIGNTVVHTFTIRNEGDAVLLLDEPRRAEAQANYQVQCTLSSRRVAPGKSATARVAIRPLEVSTKLYAGVTIGTNGPEQRLRIGGRLVVQEPLVLQSPDGEAAAAVWELKTGEDGEPVAARGHLYSVEHERFRILSINSDDPGIPARAKPLSAAELEKLHAKSGYALVVGPNDMKRVGRFQARLTIRTDVAHGGTKHLDVQGIRWGPVRVVNPGGIKWSSDTARADLGLFPAKTGKTATLFLVITAPADAPPLSIRETRSSAAVLRVSAERDARRSTDSTSWFQLTLQVPPGRQPESRTRDNPVEVSLNTSHPRAETIRLLVQFVSY